MLPGYVENMNVTYRPNPDHMSTTDLVKPPLMRSLYIKHFDEIVQDPTRKFKMFDGIAWDEYVKKHCRWALTNIRIEIPTMDLKLICKPDYYHVLDHTLADIKKKSVWNINNFDPKGLFTKYDVAQVNIYCYAMNKATDLPVDKLQLHIFGRDWRPGEKLRHGHDYPDHELGIIDVPHWTTKEQEAYIDAQMKDHILNPFRECTDEEKGKEPDKWAVKKKGNKTAQGGKVCNSEAEAHNFIKAHPEKKWEIEFRPGNFVRCQKYCNVSAVCPFNKEGSKASKL